MSKIETDLGFLHPENNVYSSSPNFSKDTFSAYPKSSSESDFKSSTRLALTAFKIDK
ncbi:unnamed protein product [marine sediment metagenome]|uniref:Uncharacterized protein n=1 Tax=marine sediment metagenome TaxID=412755 RepID=X1BA47_9ZZZZ